MFARLRELFDALGEGEAQKPARDALQLATVALMVEEARTDDGFNAPERARMLELVERRFGLDAGAAERLIEAAEADAEASSGIFRYAQTIIERCDPEDRVWVLEMLWEIAYADGTLRPIEASLIRRVAGLIGVPDKESGAARKRVMARLGIA